MAIGLTKPITVAEAGPQLREPRCGRALGAQTQTSRSWIWPPHKLIDLVQLRYLLLARLCMLPMSPPRVADALVLVILVTADRQMEALPTMLVLLLVYPRRRRAIMVSLREQLKTAP